MDDHKYSIAAFEAFARFACDQLNSFERRARTEAGMPADSYIPVTYAPLKTPVQDWEADWFLRGVNDLGLFTVEPHECASGFCASAYRSHALAGSVDKEREAHFLRTVSKLGRTRTVAREAVTQMAAFAQLVGEFGHLPENVQLESPDLAVDFEVFDRSIDGPARRLILGGEAKVTRRDHGALVDGMKACRGTGGEAAHRNSVRSKFGRSLSDSEARNHHRQCTWLLQELPATFWVVSSEGPSEVFAVSFPAHREFDLGDLPLPELARRAVEERGRAPE